jgi:hypothetical protein
VTRDAEDVNSTKADLPSPEAPSPEVSFPEAPSPESASPARRRHSGYGIASLVIAVLCAGVIAVLVGAIIHIGTNSPGRLREGDPLAFQIGAGIAVAGIGHGVGLVLGGAGLFQRRRKVTAIVGTIVNGVVFLALVWALMSSLAKRGRATEGVTDEPGEIVDARPVMHRVGRFPPVDGDSRLTVSLLTAEMLLARTA